MQDRVQLLLMQGLSPILTGQITASSGEGQKLIMEALGKNPEMTVRILDEVNGDVLEKTMQRAGFSNSRIGELLRTGVDDRTPDPRLQEKIEVQDPFCDKAPDEDLSSPYPDPALDISRGPTPFRRS